MLERDRLNAVSHEAASNRQPRSDEAAPSAAYGPEPDATVEQLRSAIDSGQTGDKTSFPDPAAAPLGTDDEAGGTPTPAHLVAETMKRETDGPKAMSDVSNGPGIGSVLFAVVSAVIILAIFLLLAGG